MVKIYDVTLPYSSELPSWPGEPKPVLRKLSSMAEGAEANVTFVEACVHFATHVDAPCHFVEGGGAVEALPLDVMVGPCLVIDAGDAPVIGPDLISRAAGEPRVLFKTTNSALWRRPGHDFHRDFVALSQEAARAAVAAGIKLVGVDYLSVQRFADTEPTTHQVLLEAKVVVIEGLNLDEVPAGRYELLCLPMKIVGSDGAPARVVLREMECKR